MPDSPASPTAPAAPDIQPSAFSKVPVAIKCCRNGENSKNPLPPQSAPGSSPPAASTAACLPPGHTDPTQHSLAKPPQDVPRPYPDPATGTACPLSTPA